MPIPEPSASKDFKGTKSESVYETEQQAYADEHFLLQDFKSNEALNCICRLAKNDITYEDSYRKFSRYNVENYCAVVNKGVMLW